MPDPVVVLGAGPAGLGAGVALGEQALVVESSSDLGGLCQSVTLDGAVFDLGGHSFHTPHPEVRELVFQALPMYEQTRKAWCFVKGEWVPYPFQKHFEKLRDEAVRAECRQTLPGGGGRTWALDRSTARHFGEHLEQRFGAGLTRHFLRPYNEKLWGSDLKRLAADWSGERVAAPAGSTETFVSHGGKRTPLQDDTRVAYPACGGFGEIFRALARRLPRLRLGETVVRIEPRRRELVTARGEVLRWRRLISTLALDRLLRLLPDVPRPLAESAGQLEALPLALVFVVVNHPVDTPVQRVYCPDDTIPAHKVVLNHNSSPWLRTLPRHGILAEVARPAPEPDAVLTDRVLAGLLTLGLLRSREEVCSTRVIHLLAAYPVPTHDRAAIVGQLKQWLACQGIDTVGRFGEWAYINSDEALARGMKLGREAAVAA